MVQTPVMGERRFRELTGRSWDALLSATAVVMTESGKSDKVQIQSGVQKAATQQGAVGSGPAEGATVQYPLFRLGLLRPR
jgi:hypothetical protein